MQLQFDLDTLQSALVLFSKSERYQKPVLLSVRSSPVITDEWNVPQFHLYMHHELIRFDTPRL